MFCGTGSVVPDSDVAQLRIVLAKEEQSADLLACAENDNSVKIHFDEARFEFPDMFGKPSVVVGPVAAPKYNGMLVILHEVGHWFKLPHIIPSGGKSSEFVKKYDLEDIYDFMMPIYKKEMCRSSLTFALITNMSDPDTYKNHFADGGCLLAK